MASSADRRPAWSCPYHRLPCQRGPHRGKERPGDPEGLPLPLVFLFCPVVTRAFPWPIKEKAGRPIKGHRFTTSHITPHQVKITSIKPRTHNRAATEPSVPICSSHQRLGTCPSLDCLYPYDEPLLVLITRAASDWT